MGLAYMYLRSNSPTKPAGVMFSRLIAFVLTLQQVVALGLDYPAFVVSLKDGASTFTVQGWLKIINIQLSCMAGGSGSTAGSSFELLVPLLPFAFFALAGSLGKLCGKPLRLDYAINVIGIIFKALFLGLMSLCLQLWFVDEMPNGRLMVTAYPGMERFSDDWYKMLPATLVAFLLYTISFLAFMTHAVWLAPRWAATWPGFIERYRFMLGALRPDRWWWSLLHILLNLAIVLVRAMANGRVYVELYGVTFVLLSMAMLELVVRPYRFVAVNNMSCLMNFSVLIFAVTTTSLLDVVAYETDEEVEFTRSCCAVICAILVFGVLAYTCISMCHTVLSRAHSCTISGTAMQAAFEFRDVVSELALLSDRDFLAALVTLGEVDLEMLRASMSTLVAVFLRQQPGASLFSQRVMPGTPIQVWDSGASAMHVIRSTLAGETQIIAGNNATCRLLVMQLAEDLRVACAKTASAPNTVVRGVQTCLASQRRTAIASHRRRVSFAARVSHTFAPQTLLGTISAYRKKRQTSVMVDSGEFSSLVGPICTLSGPELNRVYNFLDHSGTGAVPLDFALAALVTFVPNCEEGAIHLSSMRRDESESTWEARATLVEQRSFITAESSSEHTPESDQAGGRTHVALESLEANAPTAPEAHAEVAPSKDLPEGDAPIAPEEFPLPKTHVEFEQLRPAQPVAPLQLKGDDAPDFVF
eukprot:NODE_126_length_3572_cov_5.735849.p1 GENE.NODE_126_length_3572_cov_5.735849~~NODE_126_length_3572_cov_5.735849.p1  ORF type:complete len:700 (-),score=112.93 NODE_126_length_3572_cov_5.735849:89-2188(-)